MFLKNFKELFLCLHFNAAGVGRNDKTQRTISQRKEKQKQREVQQKAEPVAQSLLHPSGNQGKSAFQWVCDWGQPGTAMTSSASQGKRQLKEKSFSLGEGPVTGLIFPVPYTRHSPGFVITDSFTSHVAHGQSSRLERRKSIRGLNLNPCLKSYSTLLKVEPKLFLWFFSKLPADFTGSDLRISRQSLSHVPVSMPLHSPQPSG